MLVSLHQRKALLELRLIALQIAYDCSSFTTLQFLLNSNRAIFLIFCFVDILFWLLLMYPGFGGPVVTVGLAT
jgi:hypothetical protein